MSTIQKANRFIKVAKESGWETKWESGENFGWVNVIATRGAESIEISWQDNTLTGSPIYKFHEMVRKIHSRLDAERTLQRTKPDVEAYQRYQRSQRANPAGNGTPVAASTSDLELGLPFDIENDPDSVILKAIRGNTILWRNSITGQMERCWVPWKVSTKKGWQLYNVDLENVFFLASSSDGKDYLSFMDANGHFRAVHLEAIKSVV